jgi:hypothetical protein
VRRIQSEAFETIKGLYAEHPRLMVTVHTVLAARHGYHMLGERVHEYPLRAISVADRNPDLAEISLRV